jgi:hypothetical protein
VKFGLTSISGPYQQISDTLLPISGTASPYYDYRFASGSTAQAQSPLTLTIAPGNALLINGLSSSATNVVVYFQELRLAGSY